MKSQNYRNHVRFIPAFHFFLLPLGWITLIAAIVYLVISVRSGGPMFASLLFVVLSLISPFNDEPNYRTSFCFG